MYKIYNHSSEKMLEIKNNSVNLILAGPPYNIGTQYGNNFDNVNFREYKNSIISALKESFRVLKDDGTLVIEAADSVLMNGEYVALAGLLQKIAIDVGFYICGRDINFVHTKAKIELPEDERWTKDYTTKINAHSNCHQWMAFSKQKRGFAAGTISYIDYISMLDHPCPFPKEVVKYLLDKYFTKGTVLDPFMGTAVLGKEVIKRGGNFIGFEIDKQIFSVAEKSLLKNNKLN